MTTTWKNTIRGFIFKSGKNIWITICFCLFVFLSCFLLFDSLLCILGEEQHRLQNPHDSIQTSTGIERSTNYVRSLCLCCISYATLGPLKCRITRTAVTVEHSLHTGIFTDVYGEEQGDAGEAQILERQENEHIHRFHSVIHERPLQAGHGSLGYGGGDNVFNSKNYQEHQLYINNLI